MRDRTHQAMRDTLASMIRDLKRDYKRMEDDRNIQYDLGYIYGLNYAISLYINHEFWMYKIPEIDRANRCIERLVEKMGV
tara:strand:+ start:238 stop:477 length:240 start_codon:yes stop_codon:yes gene_type:complete